MYAKHAMLTTRIINQQKRGSEMSNFKQVKNKSKKAPFENMLRVTMNGLTIMGESPECVAYAKIFYDLDSRMILISYCNS